MAEASNTSYHSDEEIDRILEELEQAGIEEGDTVRMYGLHFTYYK